MSSPASRVQFDQVSTAIAALAAGGMVVVVDDDDRENEGDLIMAAASASAANVGFMVRHTSGVLCTPLSAARANQLRLPLMAADEQTLASTAFTVSVDYKPGLTTGISAAERAATIQALANSNVGADDFVRPGHVFPLIARSGGVLVRAGHTEASVDLLHMAGLPAVAVLSEVVNDDGSVQRLPQLRHFAQEHDIPLICIADLIAHRRQQEALVAPIAQFALQTRIGQANARVYRDEYTQAEYLVLQFGDIDAAQPVTVCWHSEDIASDVFGPQVVNSPTTDLTFALTQLASAQNSATPTAGVLLYKRCGNLSLEQQAAQPSKRETQRLTHWLDVGLSAQILRHLGCGQVKLYAAEPADSDAYADYGLQVLSSQSFKD